MSKEYKITDSVRERMIEDNYKKSIDETYPPSERRRYFEAMSKLISQRSPEQIEKMEKEMGL